MVFVSFEQEKLYSLDHQVQTFYGLAGWAPVFRRGSAPNPVQEGFGPGAPSYILAAKPPRSLLRCSNRRGPPLARPLPTPSGSLNSPYFLLWIVPDQGKNDDIAFLPLIIVHHRHSDFGLEFLVFHNLTSFEQLTTVCHQYRDFFRLVLLLNTKEKQWKKTGKYRAMSRSTKYP